MTDWAGKLDALAGRAVSVEAGAGAAGGLGAALLALGGRRESGASIIAEHTGLADDVAAAIIACCTTLRYATGSIFVADGGRSL